MHPNLSIWLQEGYIQSCDTWAAYSCWRQLYKSLTGTICCWSPGPSPKLSQPYAIPMHSNSSWLSLGLETFKATVLAAYCCKRSLMSELTVSTTTGASQGRPLRRWGKSLSLQPCSQPEEGGRPGGQCLPTGYSCQASC